jgi:hypothetical protein
VIQSPAEKTETERSPYHGWDQTLMTEILRDCYRTSEDRSGDKDCSSLIGRFDFLSRGLPDSESEGEAAKRDDSNPLFRNMWTSRDRVGWAIK